MKIRVLTATSKGKLKSIAAELATLAANDIYKADIIPPAYACDNERLIILIVTPSAIPHKGDYVRFIQGLNRQRSRNVAFIVDGTEEQIKPYVDTIKENNVNVVDILYMNGGLPSILSIFTGMTAEEKATVTAWYENVIKNLA